MMYLITLTFEKIDSVDGINYSSSFGVQGEESIKCQKYHKLENIRNKKEKLFLGGLDACILNVMDA